MRFIKKISILFIFLSAYQVYAQYVPIEEQKAHLIYQFPMYLIWEDDEMIVDINIGVFNASNEFERELRKACRKRYKNGSRANMIPVSSLEVIKSNYKKQPIHLLYVPNNSDADKVFSELKNYNIAIITDEYADKAKIMFNLVVPQTKVVTFQFNTQNLKKVHISTIEQISDLKGENIHAGTLLKEAKVQLDEINKTLEEQKKEIKKKEDEIEKKEALIENQNKEIEKQTRTLDEQKNELAVLVRRAKIQTEELEKKNKILNDQGEAIRLQQKKLKDQQVELERQMEQVEQQRREVKALEEKREEVEKELIQKQITIKLQKNLIYIFIVVSAIILTLAFFIFRMYRAKRKDNILLAEQKTEIERQAKELEAVNIELEKLSIVASKTSTAVTILDSQGNFEWINAAFTRTYGYTLQLLKNEMGENILSANTNPKVREIIKRCIDKKESAIYENIVETREGEKKWAQTNITPILDIKGNVQKFVLIDSDITDLKLAHEEIRQRNEEIQAQKEQLESYNKELEKLSLVASKTDNSVIIAAPDGEIEWVNDGFERLLGVPFEVFKEDYGSNLISSSLNPAILDVIEQGLRSKRSVAYTSRTVTKQGRVIWIQTTLTPIFDDDNVLNKLVAIDSDITKIKEAEEQIAKQKQKIMDSIMYASRIQQAVLPPTEYLDSFLPEHFILFKPRDYVSGDFYWATKIESKVLFTAADCTGHGVPGAFMSLLGIAFLNEIVNKIEPDQLSPDKVLKQLRENVIRYLRQEGKEGEAKDGMDIAFCILDTETYVLQYAGAHNPLYLIRNKELTQYQADDMPIGIYYNQKEFFENNVIQAQKGDTLYMFSDGFPDQFGGKRGRKFMIKRFRNMLVEIHEEKLSVQKEVLDKTLEEWKGDRIQLDDILVMGIRL